MAVKSAFKVIRLWDSRAMAHRVHIAQKAGVTEDIVMDSTVLVLGARGITYTFLKEAAFKVRFEYEKMGGDMWRAICEASP
jgi:hypothetical protein